MKATLRRIWESRSPRERMVIAVLAAVLGGASYLWLLHSADRARVQLRASVATLRTQAALLDQQATEHERLRATPAPPPSPATARPRTLAQVLGQVTAHTQACQWLVLGEETVNVVQLNLALDSLKR